MVLSTETSSSHLIHSWLQPRACSLYLSWPVLFSWGLSLYLRGLLVWHSLLASFIRTTLCFSHDHKIKGFFDNLIVIVMPHTHVYVCKLQTCSVPTSSAQCPLSVTDYNPRRGQTALLLLLVSLMKGTNPKKLCNL